MNSMWGLKVQSAQIIMNNKYLWACLCLGWATGDGCKNSSDYTWTVGGGKPLHQCLIVPFPSPPLSSLTSCSPSCWLLLTDWWCATASQSQFESYLYIYGVQAWGFAAWVWPLWAGSRCLHPTWLLYTSTKRICIHSISFPKWALTVLYAANNLF